MTTVKPFMPMIEASFIKILLLALSLSLCAQAAVAQTFLDGEVIHYDIKKFGVKLGSATLRYEGESSVDNQEALLITFKAEGMNFLDEEKVYLDPVSMYPITIERDLNIWGNKEKIKEVYDQENFAVIVTKEVKGKLSRTTINKSGPIDNIYAFLYRYRKTGTFKQDEELILQLPTTEVFINHDKRTTLEAAGRTFNAFYLKSRPAKYQLWFSTTPERLPLRIDGTIGIAKTSMVMKAFEL